MGRTFKFGDNIDTDLIVPGKYLSLSEPEELAEVCMEGIEEGFAKKIQKGDIFVAGKNFGSGSSREHAPISIKAAGVDCIIAESFARIFYRNSINIGLSLLESKEASDSIAEGDIIYVNYKEGFINNESKNKTYHFAPYSESILDIINAGGYKAYIKNQKNNLK